VSLQTNVPSCHVRADAWESGPALPSLPCRDDGKNPALNIQEPVDMLFSRQAVPPFRPG